jgi:hypothetical protein
MKTRIILICMLLSAAAWGAEPATDTAATADTAAPAAQSVKPAEQTATPPAGDAQSTMTPAASGQKPSQTSAESGFSRGSVVRSVFTSGVKDREPVDKLSHSKTHDNHIYFFTELRDMSGQTAVHRWEHDGKVAAEVKFKVRGPRWRVWSSKTFSPNATGEWKVSVLNGAGEVIAEDEIDYTGPAPEQQPAATAKPAATQAPATTAAPADQQAPAQQPATTDTMPQ